MIPSLLRRSVAPQSGNFSCCPRLGCLVGCARSQQRIRQCILTSLSLVEAERNNKRGYKSGGGPAQGHCVLVAPFPYRKSVIRQPDTPYQVHDRTSLVIPRPQCLVYTNSLQTVLLGTPRSPRLRTKLISTTIRDQEMLSPLCFNDGPSMRLLPRAVRQVLESQVSIDKNCHDQTPVNKDIILLCCPLTISLRSTIYPRVILEYPPLTKGNR